MSKHVDPQNLVTMKCYGDKPDVASLDGSWESVFDSRNAVCVSVEHLHDPMGKNENNLRL